MSNIKIIVGSNFGDEGKGLMTDYFAAQARDRGENCIVICSNGGSQRGHTATTPDGIRHVFHHFGSGTLAGADTYLPEYFIVNPISFRTEYEWLERNYINPKVYVNQMCYVSNPFDMMANQIIENSRGDTRHGSCGMGIWETILRHKSSKYQTTIKGYHGINKNKIYFDLVNVKNYYEERFSEMGIKIPDAYLDAWNSETIIYHFIQDVEFMMQHMCLSDIEIIGNEYENIIFENGQGLMLDQNIKGYGEHITPSNTGIENSVNMIKHIYGNKNVEVCYVTRTYLTRHGAGRFDEECDKSEINPEINDVTNSHNEFQGNLRYGKININGLIERIDYDFIDAPEEWERSLAITHINEYPWDFDVYNKKFDYIYKSDGEMRTSVKREVMI